MTSVARPSAGRGQAVAGPRPSPGRGKRDTQAYKSAQKMAQGNHLGRRQEGHVPDQKNGDEMADTPAVAQFGQVGKVRILRHERFDQASK